MSKAINLNSLVNQPPSKAQATTELNNLDAAGKLSGGLNPKGEKVKQALEALLQGDQGAKGSGGSPKSGGCSDSSSTKGACEKPAAGAFIVKEEKTPNLERIPAGTAGSNPNLAEGRVPNPEVAPTVTASADTAPAVAAPAVAAPAVTTPPAAPTPAIPADWQAGSAAVI